MKNTIAFLFIIIGFSCNGHELDSLLKEYKKSNDLEIKILLLEQIAEVSFYQNPSLTKKYADQLKDLSKKNNDLNGIAAANLIYGKIYGKKNDFEKSDYYIKIAKDIFEKQKNESGLLKMNLLIADNEMRRGNFELAIKVLHENLKISRKSKKRKDEAMSLALLGLVFYYNQQFEEGIDYLKQALKIIREVGAKREESIVLLNLTTCSLNFERFEEADKYQQQFFVIQHKLNDPVLLGSGYVTLASIYTLTNRPLLAFPLYEDALKIFQDLNDTTRMIPLYRNRAELFLEVKNYHQVIKDCERALFLIGKRHESDVMKLDIYNKIYLANKALGNYKAANEALEIVQQLKDKALSLETNETIYTLKEQYEAEQKEEKIKLLQQQNKTKDVRLKARTYSIIALSLLLILVVFAVVFVRRQSKLKQQKKTAELENKALRAQMNPHFIFNALNSIQRIYVEGNIEKANDFMGDFAQLMRKVLENSSNSKISIHEELETLRLYMDLEKLRCKNKFSYTISVDENISIFNAHIPPLIIQPFVENAIWHGVLPLTNTEGEIKISLKQKSADSVLITIADNGVGFNNEEKSEKHSSKGMKITEQRIGEKVTISSESGQGTIISFTVKTAL